MPTPAPQRTYENITPEKWKRVKANASRYNLTINADKGEAEAYGAKISWTWTAPKLVVTLVQAGMLSEYMVLSYVDSIVKPA